MHPPFSIPDFSDRLQRYAKRRSVLRWRLRARSDGQNLLFGQFGARISFALMAVVGFSTFCDLIGHIVSTRSEE